MRKTKPEDWQNTLHGRRMQPAHLYPIKTPNPCHGPHLQLFLQLDSSLTSEAWFNKETVSLQHGSVQQFLPSLPLSVYTRLYCLFYVYGCLTCIICKCTACVPGVREGQKRVLDPLKVELQRGVRCHSGNQTRVLCESSKCFYPLSHLPSPSYWGYCYITL